MHELGIHELGIYELGIRELSIHELGIRELGIYELGIMLLIHRILYPNPQNPRSSLLWSIEPSIYDFLNPPAKTNVSSIMIKCLEWFIELSIIIKVYPHPQYIHLGKHKTQDWDVSWNINSDWTNVAGGGELLIKL